MYDTLQIEIDSHGVASLWLDRPNKHNAMSATMIAELTEVTKVLASEQKVRVVVLGGRGKSFCAGGDLDWMRAQLVANAAARTREATGLARMLQALNDLPKPLIGRAHGNAFGGGIGLLSVCDIAIGVEGALMGFTETRLGLIPATIGPYVCARMGEARARRVFMSGRRFAATEAVELGLLSKAVPADQINSAIAAEVAPYLSCAPVAVARAKALLRNLGPVIDAAVIDHSIAELVACWARAEPSEGISAFFDKRKPEWAE